MKVATDPLPYQDGFAHLDAELRHLDVLIARRVRTLRSRRVEAKGTTASRGVYITHEEVDALLNQEGSHDVHSSAPISDQLDIIAAEISATLKNGIFLSLPFIAQLFGLSPFEVRTVIVCLAPELRPQYDTLYSYLQHDITRKRPSVDLVLDILCSSEAERWRARTTVFSDEAPLFRHGILHRIENSRFLKLDDRILHYVLENDALEARLIPYVTLLQPSGTLDQVLVDPVLKTHVANLCRRRLPHSFSERQPFVFWFQGPRGVGKRDLALGLCSQWGRPMLWVDMTLLLACEPDVATALRLVFREGLLWGAAVYFDFGPIPLGEGADVKAWMRTLARLVEEYGQITFVAGEVQYPPQGVFDQENFCAVEFPMPGVSLRRVAWERILDGRVGDPTGWAQELARQFRLTPGQIREAAASAEQKQVMKADERALTRSGLYAVCRKQSHHKLAELPEGGQNPFAPILLRNLDSSAFTKRGN